MFEYILREIFLSVIAFLAGAGVSAGVFAFVLVIGVVPRILRCSRIENIILIENVMICGVVAGNISSVLDTAYNLDFANMPKVPVSNICDHCFSCAGLPWRHDSVSGRCGAGKYPMAC